MFDKDPAFVSNAFRFTLVPTHTASGFAVIVGFANREIRNESPLTQEPSRILIQYCPLVVNPLTKPDELTVAGAGFPIAVTHSWVFCNGGSCTLLVGSQIATKGSGNTGGINSSTTIAVSGKDSQPKLDVTVSTYTPSTSTNGFCSSDEYPLGPVQE